MKRRVGEEREREDKNRKKDSEWRGCSAGWGGRSRTRHRALVVHAIQIVDDVLKHNVRRIHAAPGARG